MNAESTHPRIRTWLAVAWLICVTSGCRCFPTGSPISPTPVGTVLDQANQTQEENAEAADFIVYMHEFELNESAAPPAGGRKSTVNLNQPVGFRLNRLGRDHVRRIAFELAHGTQRMVVVERSTTSKRADTSYEYPVHENSMLDEQRRRIVVNSLFALGVSEAEQIVVVAPAFPTGLHSAEASQAYSRSLGGGMQGQGSGNANANRGFGGAQNSGFGISIGGGFGGGQQSF